MPTPTIVFQRALLSPSPTSLLRPIPLVYLLIQGGWLPPGPAVHPGPTRSRTMAEPALQRRRDARPKRSAVCAFPSPPLSNSYPFRHPAFCHDISYIKLTNQIPHLLPPHRQHLLPPLHPTIQTQAPHLPLLGLSPERPSPRDPQVQRPQQEEAQAHRPRPRPL